MLRGSDASTLEPVSDNAGVGTLRLFQKELAHGRLFFYGGVFFEYI